MSTIASLFDLNAPAPSSPVPAPAMPSRQTERRAGAGPLSALLLAALVAGLVVLADRFVSTWADEHLLLGWALMWAVIFAGLALFAGTASSLAARTMRRLDAWSQALARSRAEARLWDIARSDPRVMADLKAVRAHTEGDDDFSVALAPTGLEPALPAPVAGGWVGYVERFGQNRVRNMHLHYV
jgi:hypothetical protein